MVRWCVDVCKFDCQCLVIRTLMGLGVSIKYVLYLHYANKLFVHCHHFVSAHTKLYCHHRELSFLRVGISKLLTQEATCMLPAICAIKCKPEFIRIQRDRIYQG